MVSIPWRARHHRPASPARSRSIVAVNVVEGKPVPPPWGPNVERGWRLEPGIPGRFSHVCHDMAQATLTPVNSIAYVIGARPNFVKMAPLIAEMRERAPS